MKFTGKNSQDLVLPECLWGVGRVRPSLALREDAAIAG